MVDRLRRVGEKMDENVLSLAELVDPLDTREVDALAVSAIKQHRLHLAEAEDAYEAWMAVEGQDNDRARHLKTVYVHAMLLNYAQMTVVEALINKLGRIPSIDDDNQRGPVK
jgi:hypothetical protein